MYGSIDEAVREDNLDSELSVPRKLRFYLTQKPLYPSGIRTYIAQAYSRDGAYIDPAPGFVRGYPHHDVVLKTEPECRISSLYAAISLARFNYLPAHFDCS